MNRLVPIGLALALIAGCASQPATTDGRTTAPQPATSNKLADVQTRLGIGYMGQGKLDLAYDRLSKALLLDPDYSTAHNAMALLHERLQNTPKAEEHYRKAVELNPMDSAAQTNYGSFLCRTGRPEEGEQRFLQALKNSLYDRPELAYANAGLCAKSAGSLTKAESYFRSALERNAKIPSALISMSELSLEAGRHLPARAYLQRYLEVSEHSPRTLWLGIRIERELGDRRTEQEYAMRLKTRFPDSRETQLLLESEG
jgi:type IV pilus assembly protein PilF